MENDNSNKSIFQVNNILKMFRNRKGLIYRNSVNIKEGSLTFITGTSGVGKSTLLNILALLDVCSKVDNTSVLIYRYGEQEFNYFDLYHGRLYQYFFGAMKSICSLMRRKDFGYLPQHGHLLHPFTIEENLKTVHFMRRNYRNHDRNSFDIQLESVLSKVGLSNDQPDGLDILSRIKRSPALISGGQSQRLALARAIINKPRVIFVDEPTTYMDEAITKIAMDVLQQLVAEEKRTVIIVTHEIYEMSGFLSSKMKLKTDCIKLNKKGKDETGNITIIEVDNIPLKV